MAIQDGSITTPQVFNRDQAELLEAFGQRVWILLPASATNGTASFAEVEVPPGEGPPYHIHRREDETFIVRKGLFEFIVNGERHEAKPGDVVYGPRNIPHTFRNISEQPAFLQVLSVSAGFEAFFRDCSNATKAGAQMPEFLEIAANHGLEFLPPDFETQPQEVPANVPLPHITRAGQALPIAFGNQQLSAPVTTQHTHGAYALLAACPECEPGEAQEDRIFIVDSGELTFGSGDSQFTARSGDIVWANRGLKHDFSHAASSPATGFTVLLTSTGD